MTKQEHRVKLAEVGMSQRRLQASEATVQKARSIHWLHHCFYCLDVDELICLKKVLNFLEVIYVGLCMCQQLQHVVDDLGIRRDDLNQTIVNMLTEARE